MRHHVNVVGKKNAQKNCRLIVKDTGNTCVVEKAKCRGGIKEKLHVCYRLWEDRDDPSGRIIDIKQWDQERKGLRRQGSLR